MLDALPHPCYLETSSPAGRRLFERHGYEVRDTLALPGRDAPPVWSMVRV